MSYTIFTDTSANLPTPLLRELGIEAIPFSYHIDGNTFTCTDTENFDGAAFYGSIRRGTVVTTSLVNPQQYLDAFRPVASKGEDILFIGMSSGISGSYGAAGLAADQIREEFPGVCVETVDTLSASLGEGLLVTHAARRKKEGATLMELKEELDLLRVKMCQVFTVDDLMFLRRTGRLSNVEAMVGTVLNIKPLLKGNENGNIVSFAKLRGRKRSIEGIAAQYDRLVERAEEQTIGIAHADCKADCDYLCTLLRRNHPPKEILVVDYEPVTGSHVGPGALALFFLGSADFRSEKKL